LGLQEIDHELPKAEAMLFKSQIKPNELSDLWKEFREKCLPDEKLDLVQKI
jgi:5'-deoxynucleotidase YfbR-like HD superfamily hydrolase